MGRAPKPARRRTNDPEGLRRRVLDVAATLFQKAGYANTAMHDIAREAGVTGGGMHHHFPTKKSVALAVIEERVRGAVEETWIAPVLNAASVQEGVGLVFDDISHSLSEAGRVNGCPLNNLALELSLVDPDMRMAMESVFADWKSALVTRIERDQGDGRLRHLSAERLATVIIASYSGAMAIAKVEQHPGALKLCGADLADRMRA